MMYLSVSATFATMSFFGGFILFIVAFSTTVWVAIDGKRYISLWKICTVVEGEWICEYWSKIPDFIRASQGFCIIALGAFVISMMVLIVYICVPNMHKMRGFLVTMSMLTFTAASMIVMCLVVMGVKGGDFFDDLRRENDQSAHYLSKVEDLSGSIFIGWSYALAIVSAIFTYICFIICTIEYRRKATSENSAE